MKLRRTNKVGKFEVKKVKNKGAVSKNVVGSRSLHAPLKFVLFVLSAESMKFSSIRKPCTYNSECMRHRPRCTKLHIVRKLANARVRHFYAYEEFCDYSTMTIVPFHRRFNSGCVALRFFHNYKQNTNILLVLTCLLGRHKWVAWHDHSSVPQRETEGSSCGPWSCLEEEWQWTWAS